MDDFLEWTKELSSADVSEALIELDELDVGDDDDRELIPGTGYASFPWRMNEQGGPVRLCCDRCPNGSCRSCPCAAAGRSACPATGQPYRPAVRRPVAPVRRHGVPNGGASPPAPPGRLDSAPRLSDSSASPTKRNAKPLGQLSKSCSGGACEACEPNGAQAGGGPMLQAFMYYANADALLEEGMSTKDFLKLFPVLVFMVIVTLVVLAKLGKL